MKTGTKNGKPAISKPLFMLALFDMIAAGELHSNSFNSENKDLQKRFKDYYISFFEIPQSGIRPAFLRPFFHLHSEPFYELVWKGEERPATKAHTPTGKYLRENLEYAKLDDGLWEVLQVEENREYLKRAIVERYLTTEAEEPNPYADIDIEQLWAADWNPYDGSEYSPPK